MPPKTSYPLSDDDYDELVSENELDGAEDLKPDTGPFGGSIVKPRHVTTSCKQLHGTLRMKFDLKTCKEIRDLIHKGGIELCPAYQRDVVWPHSKMIGLIQSLYLNYYIPPLIFAIINDPMTGEETRTCIDGKQRCSSVVEFMDGKIPFISPATGEKYWYKKAKPTERGHLCTPAMRSKFDMIQIQAVEYDGVSDEVQRDIFQRVQMGVPLSAPEKLQAIPSELTTYIMELAKKYVFEEGTLADNIDWDVTRGKPFQSIASMMYMCWYVDSRQAVSSTTLKRWLEKSEPLDEGFKKRMEKVLEIILDIAIHYPDIAFAVGNTAKPPRVAPVELWFMGYMTYRRMSTTTIGGLARQFGEMRNATRKAHKDVFTNTKVISWIYKWLDELPVLKAGPGQQVAAVEWEGEDPEASLARKRKRALREEEEDPDYRGPMSGKKSNGRATGSASKTTRSAAQSSTLSRPTAPPPPPAVRPSLSGMDAAPINHNPSFGQASQPDPRVHNRHNGIYGPPPTQPAAYNAGGYQQQAQARASTQPQWAQHNVPHGPRR